MAMAKAYIDMGNQDQLQHFLPIIFDFDPTNMHAN